MAGLSVPDSLVTIWPDSEYDHVLPQLSESNVSAYVMDQVSSIIKRHSYDAFRP